MKTELRNLQRALRQRLRGENLVCGFRRPDSPILLCARRNGKGWEIDCCTRPPAGSDLRVLEIGLPCPDYADYRAADGYFDHEGATEYEMRLSARHLARHLEQWSRQLLVVEGRRQQAPALSLAA